MEQENHPDLSNTISRTYFRCEGFEYGFILSDHGLVHRGRTGVIRVCHVAFRSEVKEKMSAIRKTWYLLFVLGAMVYWTYEPTSLFTHWERYLIVAVSFALIDAFIFLSAYVKKLAGSELKQTQEKFLKKTTKCSTCISIG